MAVLSVCRSLPQSVAVESTHHQLRGVGSKAFSTPSSPPHHVCAVKITSLFSPLLAFCPHLSIFSINFASHRFFSHVSVTPLFPILRFLLLSLNVYLHVSFTSTFLHGCQLSFPFFITVLIIIFSVVSPLFFSPFPVSFLLS